VVKLNKIYTKTGDAGETGLVSGARRAKHDVRVEAYGAVDEANAVIGLARLDADGEADAVLGRIQNDLFDLGADLATPGEIMPGDKALRIASGQVERLEREIDAVNHDLAPLTSFVLPGGTALSAKLHLARTVVRRAERRMTALSAAEPVNPEAIKYVNRLSDLLFVLARHANDRGGRDVLWTPGANR
jgi:cob(I)alamin adenosyltransferase